MLTKSSSTSTRDQILNMLKMQKRLTVVEIAKQLKITEMAIRRHLNTLERDQYVEATIVRQKMGRPIKVYQLTAVGEELFPRNYKSLAMDFIEDLEKMNGKEFVNELFERRQQRLKRKYEERFENKSFTEKIEELAKIQTENGYMVKLKKMEDGVFELKEYNCPIRDVANKFEKACHCELELFRELLGTDKIERHSCLGSGESCCNYRIMKA